MSKTEALDLVVLGSGPGGYVAAIRASQLGRKVSIIERSELGGVCLNWGCIPSKALLKSAHLCEEMRHASDYGFEISGLKTDFPKIIDRSRQVADKLSGGVSYLMKKNKIEVINGSGRLVEKGKLAVKDSSGKESLYSYKDLLIATGARARTIPGLEIDGDLVHTYRTMLEYRKQPKKLLVIGAGAIGIEFAYFFNAIGTQVTVVEMMDQILPVEDTEVASTLEKILVKKGLTIKTGTAVADIKKSSKGVSATFKKGGSEESWSGDCCLISIGVVPNIEGLGLEEVGIKTGKGGFIEVDEYMRTSLANHYAIGDVVGGMLLAHKASHEGIVAAECASGKKMHPMKYDNIPACTYCYPQVASVGLTEKKAKEKGIKYKVGKIPFSAIGKAIAIGAPEGFIKVLIDEEVGEVLGVHILHNEATELIAEAAVIRSHEGIAGSVLDTIHPHPTLSESVMEAMALALGKPINF
jgi:dihydrolipoamide dehydrogenase